MLGFLFYGLIFFSNAIFKKKFGSYPCRILRKIEVSTDTPAEFKLGIQLLTYRGGGRRENGGRGWRRHRNNRGRKGIERNP